MLPTTIDACRSIFKADPTLTPVNRATILAAIKNHGKVPENSVPIIPPEPRILRRNQVAERLNRSIRSVDALAKAEIIHKIRLPGRVRSCGFRESEIVALIQGAANE